MTRAFLLLTLLIASCGPSRTIYACGSTCGLEVEFPVPPGWCAGLQVLEDRAIRAFMRVQDDPRLRHACQSFEDWTVDVQQGESFSDGVRPFPLAGMTDCQARRIYVGNDPPADGALAHELAHVAQNCEPRPPLEYEDPDHSNWKSIYAALRAEGLP